MNEYSLEGLLDLLLRPDEATRARKAATERIMEIEFFDISGTVTVCDERLGVLRSVNDSRLRHTFDGDTSKLERYVQR